jgi:hypothetical protein
MTRSTRLQSSRLSDQLSSTRADGRDDADRLDRLAALKRTRRLAVNAARRPEDHAHRMAHLVADALDVISRDSVTLTRSCYAWLYLCLPTMPSERSADEDHRAK